MTDEPLYYLRVQGPDRGRLAEVTGTRATVIEMGLRVILDQAPLWKDTYRWPSPAFTFDVSVTKP
jgi:hypothetical protein